MLDATHPSLDERYAVGYCDRCTPVPARQADQRKQRDRSTIALVREQDFPIEKWQATQERARRKKLVEQLLAGKLREGSPPWAEARSILGEFTSDARA